MAKFLLVFLPALLSAEVHTLTLPEAVRLALQQNPDVIISRLEKQRAVQAIRVVRDPFVPRIGVGSGLAYSAGFPMSIEGSAPSLFQARASQFLFNRQQSYLVAQAREAARGAGIAAQAVKAEVAFQTTSAYLDTELILRTSDQAARQMDGLQRVIDAVRSRVAEGRELPIETKRAQLTLLRARQLAQALDGDLDFAERSLAMVLGYPPDHRVRPVLNERSAPAVPLTADAAVQEALEANHEIRRLESSIAAKELEARSNRASRLPRLDLIAQYALFARFNRYEDFFQRFQRHNGQIGMSIQVPITPGPAVDALIVQGQGEIRRLRIEIEALRSRISLETREAFRQVQEAEMTREVVRLELEVDRDQVAIVLAQMEEGRASMRQVEEARFAENQRWIAFYNAQYALEKARWALARHTGELLAALK
jgi:outer membrane protein